MAKNYVILNEVKNPTDELTVHILLTKVVGYFACAQYDVLFLLHVILSMSSEQTCLQGFVSKDIHKALAFLVKNAGNDSFNALALSAE